MEPYFSLVRALLPNTPGGEVESGEGGVAVYRTLLRWQQLQILGQLFGPVRKRLGEAEFDRVIRVLRRTSPPRDPNPTRWASAFAAVLEADAAVDSLTKSLATYLALRCTVQLAQDEEWTDGLRPHACLAAFPCDPRVGLTDPAALKMTRPQILAIFRDDANRIRAVALSMHAVAAWGVATGEADHQRLAAVRVDGAALALGRDQLLDLSLLRDRGLRARAESGMLCEPLPAPEAHRRADRFP